VRVVDNRGRSVADTNAVITQPGLTVKFSADQMRWLLLITGQARTEDGIRLSEGLVVREAVETLRQVGDWNQLRGRLIARHRSEHAGRPRARH
jgi:hypothetical protein